MNRVVVGCLLLAACGGSGTDHPANNADASYPSSDAAASQGLRVAVAANPALPGTIRTDLTVTSAKFRVERLQVIGDNGQPMSDKSTLDWTTGGDPPAIVFAAAPSGLYSQVNIHFDGEIINYSYEILGTAKVSGNVRNFKIADRNTFDVDVKGFTTALSPGADATMTVHLDLKDVLDNVNYGQLNDDNGTLTMDTIDPQMVEFRDKLTEAFKKAN